MMITPRNTGRSAAGSGSMAGGRLSRRQAIGLVPVIATMPSDGLMQLVLGDAQSREPIIPVVVPVPPKEVTIRRRYSGVVPNTAIAGLELHDGVIRMRRSGGRKARPF